MGIELSSLEIPGGASRITERVRTTLSPSMADWEDAISLWSKSLSGSGAATINTGEGGDLTLGTTEVSQASARINLDPTPDFPFWDSNPIYNLPSLVFIDGTITGQTYDAYAVVGGFGSTPDLGSEKMFGFKVEVVSGTATLKAINGDESNSTETVIAGIDLTVGHTFIANYESGKRIRFYVDGVLVATHTTNLPTGARTDSSNEHLFNFCIHRDTSGGTNECKMRINPPLISYEGVRA